MPHRCQRHDVLSTSLRVPGGNRSELSPDIEFSPSGGDHLICPRSRENVEAQGVVGAGVAMGEGGHEGRHVRKDSLKTCSGVSFPQRRHR